jgi:hypothetical protein
MQPPSFLDHAKVLRWAWSGNTPFGVVPISDTNSSIEIYGLAICQYEGAEGFYRFSCDRNWEVIQDADYSSVEEAIIYLPAQYKNVEIVWNSFQE